MKKTILIIDDFETTRFTVGMTLTGHGFEVIKASNAEEALTLLDGQTINLIISDYNMPGKNGAEFTQIVRQHELYKRVPILILSTDSSPEKKQDALNKGATGWVKKPFVLEDFIKMINRVIK